MSILGKPFDLPMVDEKVQVNKIKTSSISAFDLPPSSTVANEALVKMGNTFDGSGPFKKPNSTSKTFSEYSADKAKEINRGLMPANNSELTKSQAESFMPEQRVSAKNVNQQQPSGNSDANDDHMVKLTAKNPLNTGEMEVIKFNVLPQVVENRTVSYEAIQPAQFPGAFQKYKGTDSVQWSLNATFISRNSEEAGNNLRDLNILRAWTLPYFGLKVEQEYPNKLGAPPPVLILEGLRRKMIGPVPVVITSLNWDFPKDVDYLPAMVEGVAVPFPAVLQVAIQMVESFSTTEFNNLSLADYRSGNLSSNTRQITPVEAAGEYEEEAQTVGAGAGRGFINPAMASSIKSELKVKT